MSARSTPGFLPRPHAALTVMLILAAFAWQRSSAAPSVPSPAPAKSAPAPAAAPALAASATPAAPPHARAVAPYDLTGYWVAVVTQDWRYRMVLPGKGEYGGIPINLAAKKFADAWSPDADEATGQQCKAYGVGALMRIPERLHITWQDDDTLKVETDAGEQTRLLRFNASPEARAAAPSLQGLSLASWVFARVTGRSSMGGDPPVRGPGLFVTTTPGTNALPSKAERAAPPRYGTLKVETANALPGYLRKNGVPYSAQMSMTEYWDLRVADNGDQWLAITTELDDPEYLQSPFAFAPNFKKEPNGAKWDPSPCTLRW
jgi:hypothetical protein